MTQHVAEADTQLKLFLMNSVFLSGVCVPIVGPPMQGKQGIECLFAPTDALCPGAILNSLVNTFSFLLPYFS